jgi:hypothetical protein
MGPVLLLSGAADSLEWAKNSPGRCSRFPQMGPVLLLSSVAEGLERAQHCS